MMMTVVVVAAAAAKQFLKLHNMANSSKVASYKHFFLNSLFELSSEYLICVIN